MKKIMLCLVGLVMSCSFAATTFAETTVPLGVANLALKVGYIKFTDDLFSMTENFDENEAAATMDFSSGMYIAVEGYYNVWESLYVGLEVGYTKTEDDIASFLNANSDTAYPANRNTTYNEFSMGIEYIPVQVNAKYCIEPVEDLTLGFGGGLSYNMAEISIVYDAVGSAYGDQKGHESDSQWLFGGQLFFDALYEMGSFYVGLNGTYQITQDWSNEGDSVSFNNYRISGMVGYYF